MFLKDKNKEKETGKAHLKTLVCRGFSWQLEDHL